MDYTLRNADAHGQPLGSFNWKQNCGKLYDLLRGFATGALADGRVSDEEAATFRALLANADPSLRLKRPFSDIIGRVEQIFADGRIDDEERAELHQVFELLSLETAVGSQDTPCEMIYTEPEPTIVFVDRFFTVTGKFGMGARTKVVEAIQGVGGAFTPSLSRRTHFLLVGSFVSRDWKHSDLGTKIEKALEYEIPVLREESFLRAIGR